MLTFLAFYFTSALAFLAFTFPLALYTRLAFVGTSAFVTVSPSLAFASPVTKGMRFWTRRDVCDACVAFWFCPASTGGYAESSAPALHLTTNRQLILLNTTTHGITRARSPLFQLGSLLYSALALWVGKQSKLKSVLGN